MNEREQIITFLLQACDAKTRIIEGLQQKIADFEKQLAALQVPAKDPKN